MTTPIAVDTNASAVRNQVLVLDVAALLAGCATSDGSVVQLSSVSARSTNGASVALSPTNTILYSSPSGFTGADRFSYTITNLPGCSATANVDVTVSP